MPKKLRLRRVLKAPAVPFPVVAPAIQAAKALDTEPLRGVTTMATVAAQSLTAMQAMQQLGAGMDDVSNAMAGLGLSLERQSRFSRAARAARFIPPGPYGIWRTERELYSRLRTFLESELPEAYQRVRDLDGGSDAFDFSTALILQSDVVYFFLEMARRRVSLCRLNDGFVEYYDLRGVAQYGDIKSLLAEAVKAYLSSHHFAPDVGMR